MALREEILHRVAPGQYEEPEGEYLELLNEKGDRLIVLTRTDSDPAASSADDTAEDEPTEEYPTSDEGEPLCDGKEDGQCSRVVEEPGDLCWQHEE